MNALVLQQDFGFASPSLLGRVRGRRVTPLADFTQVTDILPSHHGLLTAEHRSPGINHVSTTVPVPGARAVLLIYSTSACSGNAQGTPEMGAGGRRPPPRPGCEPSSDYSESATEQFLKSRHSPRCGHKSAVGRTQGLAESKISDPNAGGCYEAPPSRPGTFTWPPPDPRGVWKKKAGGKAVLQEGVFSG